MRKSRFTEERIVGILKGQEAAFSTLTFLIGAKGLVRSRKFEDRDFAEYFLISTLSSAALAIALMVPFRPLLSNVARPSVSRTVS